MLVSWVPGVRSRLMFPARSYRSLAATPQARSTSRRPEAARSASPAARMQVRKPVALPDVSGPAGTRTTRRTALSGPTALRSDRGRGNGPPHSHLAGVATGVPPDFARPSQRYQTPR